MSERDPFSDWLEQFAYMSEADTSNLPEWQRPIAFIHQFAVNSMCDGAGSLFYNDPDSIESLVGSFGQIGETEMGLKIRAIESILRPYVESGPPNWQSILVEQIQVGAASTAAIELETMLNDRWQALYSKLESYARSNGWTA
jgi:hypothetical protein